MKSKTKARGESPARSDEREEKNMKKFEIGKTYTMASPCMSDCVWVYTVIARTAATVTLKSDRGEIKKCGISKQLSAYDNCETVAPLGRYSMCPLLRA